MSPSRTVKIVISAVAAATAVVAFATWLRRYPAGSDEALPDLVQLMPGTFQYRAAGEFTRDGRPVEAPIIAATITRPLSVMRHQVTRGEYDRCVAAAACRAGGGPAAADVPMVKVSWWDAANYAAWLSRATGLRFRMPTDQEWMFAAGSRSSDDAFARDGADPGQRALDRYELESAIDRRIDREPMPVGHFGANEKGLLDLAGNVWEWTESCFTRGLLDAGGEPTVTATNCGVRIVQGRRRSYVTDFIRDAHAGGCGPGLPPSNLGFRLVSDDQPPNRRRASTGGWR